MKPFFSEKYYRANWERFIEPVVGEEYFNLERELEMNMKVYSEIEFSDSNALNIIRKMEAKKIAENCEKALRETMAMIKRVDNGEASYGYTTHRQENDCKFRTKVRFEFNCLQLADFKKKYL